MTLIDAFRVPCTLMEKTRVADGEGGWTTRWSAGAPFEAAIVLDSGIRELVAEAKDVTGVYTVTVDRNVVLDFHDAFRRDSDGQAFRITQVKDPTPSVASFQFNQYRAEEWELTNGQCGDDD